MLGFHFYMFVILDRLHPHDLLNDVWLSPKCRFHALPKWRIPLTIPKPTICILDHIGALPGLGNASKATPIVETTKRSGPKSGGVGRPLPEGRGHEKGPVKMGHRRQVLSTAMGGNMVIASGEERLTLVGLVLVTVDDAEGRSILFQNCGEQSMTEVDSKE